jgi:hypothetical protein
MAQALNEKPEAAMLALPSLGEPSDLARSLTRPVFGSACSTKYLKADC